MKEIKIITIERGNYWHGTYLGLPDDMRMPVNTWLRFDFEEQARRFAEANLNKVKKAVFDYLNN